MERTYDGTAGSSPVLHRRWASRAAIGLLAAALGACSGTAVAPSVPAPGSPAAGGLVSAAPATPPFPESSVGPTGPAEPSLADLPTTEVNGTVIDTGIDATQKGVGGIGGYNSDAVAAGFLWLASPNGLVRIDPASNAVSRIDEKRGAIISASGDILWRAVFFEDKIRSYRVPSGKELQEFEIPGPYGVFTTEDAVWVSEHADGAVLKLDLETGRQLGRAVVSTPECCSASAFARAGDQLFVASNKDSTIVELDPVNVRVLRTVRARGGACDIFRYAADALWTCWWDPDGNEDNLFRSVERLDPTTLEANEVVIGEHEGFPTELGGEAWIAVGDLFVRLARGTGSPDRAIRIKGPKDFQGWSAVEAFGSVWIYSRDDGRILRVDAAAFR